MLQLRTFLLELKISNCLYFDSLRTLTWYHPPRFYFILAYTGSLLVTGWRLCKMTPCSLVTAWPCIAMMGRTNSQKISHCPVDPPPFLIADTRCLGWRLSPKMNTSGFRKKCARQLVLFFPLLSDSGLVLRRPGYASWLCVPWFLNGVHGVIFELQWTLKHAVCVNTGSPRCWFRSGNFWWNFFVVFSSSILLNILGVSTCDRRQMMFVRLWHKRARFPWCIK